MMESRFGFAPPAASQLNVARKTQMYVSKLPHNRAWRSSTKVLTCNLPNPPSGFRNVSTTLRQALATLGLSVRPSLCCTGRPGGRVQVGWRGGEPSITEGRLPCRSKPTPLTVTPHSQAATPGHQLGSVRCGPACPGGSNHCGSYRDPGWWGHHVTRAATRAPSRALPRRRALCTNWKKPR